MITEPHDARHRERDAVRRRRHRATLGDQHPAIHRNAPTGHFARASAVTGQVDASRNPPGVRIQTCVGQQSPHQQANDRRVLGLEHADVQARADCAALPGGSDDDIQHLCLVTQLVREPGHGETGPGMDRLECRQQTVAHTGPRKTLIRIAWVLDDRDTPLPAPRACLVGGCAEQRSYEVAVDRSHAQRTRTTRPARDAKQHRFGLVAGRVPGGDPIKAMVGGDATSCRQARITRSRLQGRSRRQAKPLHPHRQTELDRGRSDGIRLAPGRGPDAVVHGQHADRPGVELGQDVHQTHRVGATGHQDEHPRALRHHPVSGDVGRDTLCERITHAGSLPGSVALHLQTAHGDQAERALCPGDPDRARRVAQELLDGARQVTWARGLLGFTGTYRGVPVTVQTTGMGGGSTGIVVHELIELGARLLVRAGTTGGLQEHLAPGSLIVADTAVADDGAGLAMTGGVAPPPDPELTEALATAAAASGRAVSRGTIVSSDVFYDLEAGRNEGWQARGILGVEMEAAVLFALAARHGARAGCVVTVSNQLAGANPGWLEAKERERAGVDACRVALDALVSTDT